MKLYKEKKKKYYRKKQQYSESSEVFDTSADEDSLNSEQDHDDSNREGNKKKLLLELMYDKNYRPMKFRELCVLLDVSKARRYELMREKLVFLLMENMVNQSYLRLRVPLAPHQEALALLQ